MSSLSRLRSLIDIRSGEYATASLMFTYFFLVITSFWILKPLKKTLFIGYYASSGFDIFGYSFDAPSAEALAKVMNMLVAALAVVAFSVLARRLRRQQLTYAFTTFFVLGYGCFAYFNPSTSSVGVWSFYLFGDLFSTLMVATFFSFLNDSVSSDAAKRLYGVVGFGGVLGGVFGSSAVGLWIGSLPLETWLGIAALMGGLILTVAYFAAANLSKQENSDREGEGEDRGDVPSAAEKRSEGNPALAGARLVGRSGYLMSIVAIVGLYELVSTILDFQFTSAVFHYVTDDSVRSQHFATIYAITNWTSMFVQLFLTSFIMRRFGMGTALMFLPVSVALASLGFLFTPTLMLGSLLSISDNGLSYSINQSSKEALYVPTTTEEKYQAKAFIDMFVQRFAKAIGVGISLFVKKSFVGIAGVSSLTLVVLPIVGLWGYAAYYAGRRFRALEEAGGSDPAALGKD